MAEVVKTEVVEATLSFNTDERAKLAGATVDMAEVAQEDLEFTRRMCQGIGSVPCGLVVSTTGTRSEGVQELKVECRSLETQGEHCRYSYNPSALITSARARLQRLGFVDIQEADTKQA